MRKRSILFLTLLAVGAFFARSPEAVRGIQEFWKNSGGHSDAGRRDVASVSPQSGEPASPSAPGDFTANVAELADSNTGIPAETPVPGIGGDVSAAEDGQSDEEEFMREVAAVPESELQRVLESSLHENGRNTAQFRELLVRHWAQTDPRAAASWAASVEGPAIASSAVRQAATAWADEDLTAALEWAKAMPEGTLREAAIVAIGYEAARTNSFEAFDLVASLSPSSERDALLVHFVRQWSATDPSEAVDWANRVADAALREQLVSAAAITAATQDPRGAASLVAANLNPGRTQDQAAIAVVQRWAQTDPDGAASWTSQFPDPEVKAAASLALSSAHPPSQSQAN